MEDQGRMQMGWGRFAAMIGTSTAVMFPLMYQLVYAPEHVTFSLTRLIAAFVMGAVMTAIMLAFMWSMYRGQATKLAVLAGAVVVAGVLLYLNRSQQLIGDVAFMTAMIPHHSIAINNARKAHITDPRVRRLADRIIASQVREIREMQLLTDDIRRNGSRGDADLPAREARVTPEMEAKAELAAR
jgi:multisubunit Na+/H+ antiporter MnhE subunit